MGERLNEAEITENVTSLHEVNEFNPDRAVVKFLNWTPLHVAASRGQQELFQELLSSSPELADALDSQQQSLLHLASANGHIEIVKALIHVRPEMCLARDRDGANPLHVAAMRGKVEVLDELFQANPHAARARVDNVERDTILHICVKYNQLQFLSMLLEKYLKLEFVNATDNAGNTILHLAVVAQRFEIIDHILSHTRIDVNAINASNQTAMDILLQGQKGAGEVNEDIQALLEIKHATRLYGTGVLDPRQIAEKRNGLIVAVVLIVTLVFQAGLTPPGGVWQDDSNGHKSGKAVMGSNHPMLFIVFVSCNAVGFAFSLCTLVLIVTDFALKTGYRQLMMVTQVLMIVSIATSYFISLSVVWPPSKKDRTRQVRLGSKGDIIQLVIFFILITLLVCGFVCRIWSRIAEKKATRHRSQERVNNRRRILIMLHYKRA